MKIVKLVAENLKRLKCVEIDPKGSIIEISGANGAGKSSVLDAIWWTLAGTRGMQKQPLRQGASDGVSVVELDDLKVTRRYSHTGSTLVVERKSDGVRLKTPQDVLDKLIGKIAFDPLAFSRMKPKDQFDQLRKLVKIDVDIDKIDEQNRSDFEKRTDINREVKSMQSRAEVSFPANLPSEKIDISALSEQVEKAATHNKERELEGNRRADAARQIQNLLEKALDDDAAVAHLRCEIKALEERIAKREADAASRRKAAGDLKNELDRKQPIPDAIDVTDIRKKINDAVATNSLISRREDNKALLAQIAEKRAAADALTDAIEAREKAKAAAIASAKFPVPGLGFGSNEVLLNGVPFEQGSSAEQLRASCAIAMATNPEIRVITIRDGSLLDDASMAVLGELAKGNDFQLWIEVVDTSGTVGVVLEDGVVVADNQKSEKTE